MKHKNSTSVKLGQTGENHPAWKGGRKASLNRHYEKHKQKWSQWRQDNPERARANSRLYVNRRRARMANAKGSFTFQAWMQKVAYCGWRCLYCSRHLTVENLTMDHRIPLSKGGSNWLSNMAPACMSCNCKKQAKDKK